MTEQREQDRADRRGLRTWLFNPFRYVAGGPALGMGLILIAAAGLIGSASTTHFDGVLDVHTGAEAPLWWFMAEGFVAWLALAVPLWVAGKVLSKSHVRAVDVFGTQALARAPSLVTAAAALLPGYRRYALRVAALFTKAAPGGQVQAIDPVVFAFVMVVILGTLVWMVALMYRGFAVACNLRGGKAVVGFIVAAVVGEVLSKVALWAMGRF
ncbi:MAG: hypothetical protein ACODAJ_07020 [Planctomycetota bacterium]